MTGVAGGGGGGGGGQRGCLLYYVHFLGKRVWYRVYRVSGVGGGYVVLCPFPGPAGVAQCVRHDGRMEGWSGGGGGGSVVLVVLCPLPGPVEVAQGGRGSSLAR